MPKKNEWKNREGVVYSTSANFEYSLTDRQEQATLPPKQQTLKAQLDQHGRGGKQVTLVTGFVGSSSDLETLTKLLKIRCGVGGSSKDGEILLQGDLRDKVVQVLSKEGYRAKRIG